MVNKPAIIVTGYLSQSISSLCEAMEGLEGASEIVLENNALIGGNYTELVQLKLNAIKSLAALLEAQLYSSHETYDPKQFQPFNPLNN